MSVAQGQKQHQSQERRWGRPWFPPFAKNAKDGAPSSDEGAGGVKIKIKISTKIKINVEGHGQERLLSTGRRFAPLTGEAPVSTWFGALQANSRFLPTPSPSASLRVSDSGRE